MFYRKNNPSVPGKKAHPRLPFVLAFLIPLVVMLGIFAGKGIFPFGENSFLRTDLYHQYAPFMAEFSRKLKSGGSLLYTWDISLGTNFSALYAYYLASPFNWLVALVPQDYIIEFISYMAVLKIAACSLTFCIYLSRHTNSRQIGMAFFSTFYALGGYMAAYSWNIMWLDCLVLAPLIMLGLEKLVKQGRGLFYCITLALCILTNYYISIMVCIFMVVYFICQMLLLEKASAKDLLKRTGMFIGFSLLAGGLAAAVLMPAVQALAGTASAKIYFPTTLSKYFSVFDMLTRHLMNVTVETGLDHWPNLYSGVAVLLFFPMYMFNRKISAREKAVSCILLGFMLISFSFNIPNFIWHGFHYPNSLPARQSFLYTLVLLTLCYRGYKEMDYLPRGHVVGAFWAGGIFIILAEELAEADDFPFYIFLVSFILLALYALLVYLHHRRMAPKAALIGVALLLVVIESAVNTTVTSVTTVSRTTYVSNYDAYQTLVAETADWEGNDFYRVEKDIRRTKNDGAYLGYPSASIFSSTTNAALSTFYKQMGMEGNTNATAMTGGTPLAVSMLNVKYLLSAGSIRESELITSLDKQGDITLYANNTALPLGFMVPSDFNDLWHTETSSPASVQNSFAHLAAGTDDVLLVVDSDLSGDTMTVNLTEAGHIFVHITDSSLDEITAKVGLTTKTFNNVKRGYLLDLGWCEPSDLITLTTKDGVPINGTAYIFSPETMVEVHDALADEPLIIYEKKDTHLEGTVTAKKDGLLFTTIPYEEGFTVLVDGTPVAPTVIAKAFIGIPLTEGEHTIVFDYTPAGLYQGCLITLCSVGVLALGILVSGFLSNRKKKKAAAAAAAAEQSQEENA